MCMPSGADGTRRGIEMKLFKPTAFLLWAITLFGATLLGFLALERTGARSTRRVKSRSAVPATLSPAPTAAESAPTVSVASAPVRTRHGRFSGRALLVGAMTAALLSVGLIGPALAANEIESCTPSTCTIEEWSDERNHELYWETRFGMECTKVNSEDTPVHLETGVAVLIIKAGNSNAIWQPAPAGDYSTNKDTSHWFYCGEETVEDDVIDPKGTIFGPCSDPAYYAVFDNTGSTVPITFRFRWYTNYGMHATLKTLQPGRIYTTWQHWAKPNTYVSVFYKHPDTGVWTLLQRKLTVRGNWPKCVYTPGWSTPTPV
jgi:hypothetical protein